MAQTPGSTSGRSQVPNTPEMGLSLNATPDSSTSKTTDTTTTKPGLSKQAKIGIFVAIVIVALITIGIIIWLTTKQDPYPIPADVAQCDDVENPDKPDEPEFVATIF